MACDFRPRLLRTHLAVFFADRGDVAVSKSHCDKNAQPDGLTLLAIRSDERRKSRERAHLANAGEFNRRYRRFYTRTGHTKQFSSIAAIGV